MPLRFSLVLFSVMRCLVSIINDDCLLISIHHHYGLLLINIAAAGAVDLELGEGGEGYIKTNKQK